MHAKICLAEMQKYLASQNKSINDSFTLPVIDTEHATYTFDKDVLLSAIIRNFQTLPVLYTDPDWFYDECQLWWNQYKYDFAHMWLTSELQYNPIHNYDRHEYEKSTPGVTDVETHSESDSVTHSGKDITTPSGKTKVEHKGDDTLERLGTTKTDTDTLTQSLLTTTSTVSADNANTYQPAQQVTEQRSYEPDTPDNVHTEVSHEDDKDKQNYNSYVETSYDGAKTEFEHGETVTTDYGHKITNTHDGFDVRELDITGNIGVMSTQQMMEQEYKIRKFNLYAYFANKFADNLCLGIW